ncbi:MAG: flavodoxin [Eubacteriaceae bacterium]|jgi:flavodoxin short chain|nr:flavodoxin [Eubacteriaceae bacterium]MDK2935215.1 flavodoxin [Eubacteriaceae bacterium]MDN5307792.1 flavodoxin [Eubacteriaceae bacterium]
MSKLAIVYWSGTGNTEMMANLVAEGAKKSGADVTLYSPDEFSQTIIQDYDKIAFGCPSMGSEELEDTEFEPMFSAVESLLKDKTIGLFGSYDWGDGEWMRTWQETCKSDGAVLIDNGVISQDAPDEEASEACRQLGAKLAAA